MEKYAITIRETISRTIIVEADDLAEATGAIVVDVRGSVVILTDKRTWTSLCQKKF